MDILLASSSSGKRKLSKDQGMDIISTMPDYILQHIFFFTSTKDVFQTSILSRRWQYMWMSLAKLDLEYTTSWKIKNHAHRETSENNFLEFVNRVLTSHDDSIIRRLRLSLDFLPNKFSRLDSWISIAVEHNVVELELLLGWKRQHELPCYLFTCRSLVLLNIDSYVTLKAPSCTCFLNLKKLLLSNITFADELSIHRLFSNCPVLLELELAYCYWKYIKNVTISIPSLRNLTIIGDEDGRILFGDIDGEYITDSHVNIIAANITHIEFSTYLDVEFELLDLSSLKTASLYLKCKANIEEKVAARVLRHFFWISNVKCLRLTTSTIECLSYIQASLDRLPTFYSMTRLTVDDQVYGDCAILLLKFLEKMPKLEYLELSEGGDETLWDDEHIILRDKMMQQKVPSCFISSIRTFVVKEFKSVLLQRLIIEFVLKTATVLESLCISCSKLLKKKRLSKFKGHLKRIPRVSQSSSFKFTF